MHLLNILAALSAVATSVSAVHIRNFKDDGCKGNYFQFSDVGPQVCCMLSDGAAYSSKHFLNLPNPSGIGAICARKNNLNCGTIKKEGLGTNVCIGNPNSSGSFWYDCPGCRKRGLEAFMMDVSFTEGAASPMSAAYPDIVAFEDHQFRIDETTPEEAVTALIDYFKADANYADIPEGLRQYEIVEGDEE